MLSHNDLKKGIQFILQGEPYEVLEFSFVFKGRGGSVVQAKIKNLITGSLISKTFHQGDEFEEIEIEKTNVKFVYGHRDKLVFSEEKNPSNRFELSNDIIGNGAVFLKNDQTVTGMKFKDRIINVSLPIKVHLKVKEAPPGIKGDRAQGGTKIATLETGATINVPLFIKEGDLLEINTEKGEYVRRVE